LTYTVTPLTGVTAGVPYPLAEVFFEDGFEI
jgi:hypothetical protein